MQFYTLSIGCEWYNKESRDLGNFSIGDIGYQTYIVFYFSKIRSTLSGTTHKLNSKFLSQDILIWR